MKIREGAYYRTRGGDVIGPLSAVSWCDRTFSALDLTWHEDGSYVQGVPGNLDLISEVYVSDTPPADAPAPEAKSLRDEFAMEAMKLLIPRQEYKDETFAELAYIQADAMMEARKK
jgi:hypothetical protein